MTDFLLLLLFAFVGLLLWDSQQCRMIATQAAIAACNKANLQFLDGTVHLHKYWLLRTDKIALRLCRLYLFEYSNDGNQRSIGRLVLVGKKIFEVAINAFCE